MESPVLPILAIDLRPERIQEAAAAILHRGPDQQGVFESDLVSLAATRLKIIDLAAGDQPIRLPTAIPSSSSTARFTTTRSYAANWSSAAIAFAPTRDTEVVLAAFLEWDTECFARLRGMFAVALWTESSRRLVLARDRMGIKPLFVARRGRDLYFGSELKAIFVHPEIERHLNLAALDCYLSLNYVPRRYTLVEGIEKLRPGHWLEWRAGRRARRLTGSCRAESTRDWTLDCRHAGARFAAASNRCASICSPMFRWESG